MANYATLIAAIQETIAANGNNEITGPILQQVLVSITNALGSGYQFIGIATPETTPGTPDQRVFYIGASGTYPNFGPAVIPDGNLAIFYYDSSWHYGSVAFPLGDGAVTEQKLATALVNKLFADGYKFAGIATPSTTPGTPNQQVFFVGAAGQYSNFGSPTKTVAAGYLGFFRYNNGWTLETARVGDANAVKFVEQVLTDSQKAQARTNIGAASSERLNQLQQMIDDVVIGMGQLVVSLFKKTAFISNDAETDINALEFILSGGVTRIEAVYTQSRTVYTCQSLSDLKTDLVVTAYYLDGTSTVINAYALSGNLVSGVSTITVSFGGKTTTFTVVVEEAEYYRTTDFIAYQIALASAVTSNKSVCGVINGVTYYYTHNPSAQTAIYYRACYYLFDLLWTPGESYQLEVFYHGKPSGYGILVGLQAFNQSFYNDGVINSSATKNHSSDVTDSGWLTPTDNGTSFLFAPYTAPSGTKGTRIVFKTQDQGTDVDWPSGFILDYFVIRKTS